MSKQYEIKYVGVFDFIECMSSLRYMEIIGLDNIMNGSLYEISLDDNHIIGIISNEIVLPKAYEFDTYILISINNECHIYDLKQYKIIKVIVLSENIIDIKLDNFIVIIAKEEIVIMNKDLKVIKQIPYDIEIQDYILKKDILDLLFINGRIKTYKLTEL